MNQPPLKRYQHDQDVLGFLPDTAQFAAVQKLQALYDLLVEAKSSQWAVYSQKFLHYCGVTVRCEPIKGLYFWGGVGRGKTYLMDIFYDSLPFEQRMRVHFHRFMRRVHQELKGLQHQKNPLEKVAERFAQETRIICFDEFFVSDITDAMMLAGLLEALFARGVTLVATSNIVPDSLYKDGLQRARFLPAIALLNQYTEVINVDGGTDYRLRSLEQAELYHFPLDATADSSLKHSFESLVPDIKEIQQDVVLEVEGRHITTRYHCEDVVWFDFLSLCDGPRSQNDYIELAKEYHAVLVSNVPELDGEREGQARRFIHLVDEFYDRHVKLIISAAKPIHTLYAGTSLAFEFERTESRLLEMQSHTYLARPHRP